IEGKSNQFRFDHVKMANSGCPCLIVSGYVRGVVDHNFFDLSATSGYAMYIFHTSWQGIGDVGDSSWAQPDTAGTAEALFVEDNVFHQDQSKLWWYFAIDGWYGQRVVVRYNNFRATIYTNHGTDSTGNGRGTRQYEVYNNTWTGPDGTSPWDMKGNAFTTTIG